jgi:hypothetical protein
MERFARVVIGYHGCQKAFARRLLLDPNAAAEWRPSENEWDWLGHGIYFWEHSPTRALRWAQEKHRNRGRPAVIGAVIQLGRCFDLLNESMTSILAKSYEDLVRDFQARQTALPTNLGREAKRRNLDCLVINECLRRLRTQSVEYDTVRGAFVEGQPAYPGAGFARETHIQIAVRNSDCILGVFQPHLTL